MNHWLRLWHDMPNDPKWRTIARASGRSISEVMAVYCHLLVIASQNDDRGHVSGIECHDVSHENVTNVTFVACHEINFLEGLSTSLDLEIEHIEAVLKAMQGRVLTGSKVTGWDARQPLREDSSTSGGRAKSPAQRKADERDRKKKALAAQACHAESRDVTQSHAREEERRGDLEDTAVLPREPEFPPEPPEDPRHRFAMSPIWEPDAKTFPAALMQLGIPKAVLDQDLFLEFRSHWLTEPDTCRTQAKWEQSLASHLKRNLTQQAGRNTHGHNGSGQAQSGQRAGGQRKLSAIDEVKSRIADREAREASAGLAGQALAEDDRDLRPPLDGEFRREP